MGMGGQAAPSVLKRPTACVPSVTADGGRSPESISCSLCFMSSPDPCLACFRFFWNLGTGSSAGVEGQACRTETTFFHRKLQLKINIFEK